MRRLDSRFRLTAPTDGVYLVRESDKAPGQLVVSVVYEGAVWHYKVQHLPDGRLRFYGNDFNNIHELIAFHTKNPGKILTVLTKACSKY